MRKNVGTFFARYYYFLWYHHSWWQFQVKLLNWMTTSVDIWTGRSSLQWVYRRFWMSSGYHCANCSKVWSGVTLYLLVEFIPITVFYVLILTFWINMISAPMTCNNYCLILHSQLTIYLIFKDPVSINMLTTQSHYSSVAYLVIIIVGTFYGIWNLDILKYVVPPLCINHKLSIIHIEFLNCISTLYPLFLVILTWIFIELHSQNFRPLGEVWFSAINPWRPWYKC